MESHTKMLVMTKSFPQVVSPAALLLISSSLAVGVAIGAFGFRSRPSAPASSGEIRVVAEREPKAVGGVHASHSIESEPEAPELILSMAEQANQMITPVATLKSDLPRAFGLLHFLGRWGEKDPEAALAWVRQSELGNIRKTANGFILHAFAKVNPERALDMGIQMNRNGNVDQVEPYMVMGLCLQFQPHRFAEVFELPARNGYTESMQVTFGPSTNFQQIGDYVLQKNRESGEEGWTPPAFPSNFVEEWAKQQPQAAYDFAMDQQGMKSRSQTSTAFEDFAVGYSQIATTSDGAEMISYFLTTDEVSVDESNLANRLASGTPRQFQILKEAMNALPAEEHVRMSAMVVLNASDPEKAETRRRGLSLIKEPENRIRTVQEFLKKRPAQREELATLLRTMGHSEAEIELAVNPPPE